MPVTPGFFFFSPHLDLGFIFIPYFRDNFFFFSIGYYHIYFSFMKHLFGTPSIHVTRLCFPATRIVMDLKGYLLALLLAFDFILWSDHCFQNRIWLGS